MSISLEQAIKSVKEGTLSKEQTENYYDQMCVLSAELNLELAEIEKEKALYFDLVKTAEPEASDVSIKRRWNVREKGLREIKLKRYITSTKLMISSLKRRIYAGL